MDVIDRILGLLKEIVLLWAIELHRLKAFNSLSSKVILLKMEILAWFKKETDNGQRKVKQILFEGERFDVMSIRNWRKKILGNTVV
jgi:hypothetical protein